MGFWLFENGSAGWANGRTELTNGAKNPLVKIRPLSECLIEYDF